MNNYLCQNCKNNNNGWCNAKKMNGLKKKNISECEEYQELKGNIEKIDICTTFKKGIELKNIDISNVSKEGQLKKIFEEFSEVFNAIENESDEEVAAETLDLIQAVLGYVHKTRGVSANYIMEQYPKHLEKLKDRPRKKECKKCTNKGGCCLYLSEHWDGEKEAESCKTYQESED